MSILGRIKDAKDVWVKCKGTMLALGQDDVHELWEEIIKIQTRNSRQRRKNEELLKKYNELKETINKATEYLKSISMDKTPDYIPLKDYKEYHILLGILKGSDKE